MEFAELAPEEKLVCAIFGEPAWLEGIRHFLSDEERKAVNDLLDEFVAKHGSWGERGVKVLRLRFGFEPRTEAEKAQPHSSNARSLDETKVYFGVTRERIRQIEAKALRLLRHPAWSRKLRPYLDQRVDGV